MRLKCTHGMFAHWGTIFEEGKEIVCKMNLKKSMNLKKKK
jgi:hypothetical protein